MTTHDLDEAEKLAARILVLAAGRIVADGSPEQLAYQVTGDAEIRWSRDGERFVNTTPDATEFLRDLLAATVGAVEALTLLLMIVLGLAATLPWGAIIGSLLQTPRAVSSMALVPFLGLIVASGVFAPIQVLWGWVQLVGKLLPIYWLGLGMRSALLPDSEVTLEVGESWRTVETIGVLGVWAAIDLLLAPVLLRRMARRESGSNVEARRRRAMQRTG